MPKFKCSFKITMTVEKTYVITNYEVDLTDEECFNADGIIRDEAIKDAISDKIEEDVNTDSFKPADDGEQVESSYAFGHPEFIVGPTKIE